MKTFSITVVLLLFTLNTFAQPGGPGRRQRTEQDVKNQVERLADTLKLDESQKKQLLDFELKTHRDNQTMFANFDPETADREAIRATMMKQREARQEKYQEVLTDKQWEAYSKILEQRRQNMRERREDRGGGRGRGRGRGPN